jgi:CRP-like cAMP-binding protein
MVNRAHGRARLAELGVQGGLLYAFPEQAVERLLDESVRITVPAGVCLYRDDERPRVILVLRGLLRVYLGSAGGREVTIGYARSGDVAGLVLVEGGPSPMRIEALTSASVAALRVETLRELMNTDVRVARACAVELGRQLRRAFDDLAAQAFLSVRQRLIMQLLNLATPGPDRHPVARVSHEELADSVASVREVITRTLDQLGREGLVATGRDEVVLLDPVRMSQEISQDSAPDS